VLKVGGLSEAGKVDLVWVSERSTAPVWRLGGFPILVTIPYGGRPVPRSRNDHAAVFLSCTRVHA
jgi:hypothetical protein